MDTKRMKQIFQEIEGMTGSQIGSYLRHGGINTAELLRILEDDFTVNQVEKIRDMLGDYAESNKTDMDEMKEEFLVQSRQIKAIRSCVNTLATDLQYTIANLPNLLEMVVQKQLQDVLRCYRTFHANDLVNMEATLRELYSKGFQATPENKIKFTERYLKDYFTKVVNQKVQTGAYKKYKVAVINRFQDRYEEMLAG